MASISVELTPRIDYYFDSQQNMTIPGNRSTLKDDLYILLVDWEPVSNAGATFKIFVNPLVNWLWIGSLRLLHRHPLRRLARPRPRGGTCESFAEGKAGEFGGLNA